MGMKPITITWTINGESDYNTLLQCAANLFQKNIESLEKEKEELLALNGRLENKYKDLSESITQFKSVLQQQNFQCRGESLDEIASALTRHLEGLESEIKESQDALSSITLILGESQEKGGWEKVVGRIKSNVIELSNIKDNIARILREFEIDTREDKFAALFEWMDNKRSQEKLSAEAKRRIQHILDSDGDDPEWAAIESSVEELKKIKAHSAGLAAQNIAKNKTASKWIYDRIDQIDELIRKDIDACDNEPLKEYLDEFFKRKQQKGQEFTRRDLADLIPIFNLVWWDEQDELKPYISWCESIPEIKIVLQDICQFFEIFGYAITIPGGKMSEDRSMNYQEAKANPELYSKIFKDADYPAPGCYCMIDKLALVDLLANNIIEGQCFSYHVQA